MKVTDGEYMTKYYLINYKYLVSAGNILKACTKLQEYKDVTIVFVNCYSSLSEFKSKIVRAHNSLNYWERKTSNNTIVDVEKYLNKGYNNE